MTERTKSRSGPEKRTVRPLPKGRPPIASTVPVVRDVTELKKAGENMRSLSARQEAILAAVPDIIMEVDTEKVYTWANPAGLEFFGEDVIGKEAAAYFMGEQETYSLVKPLFNGREEVFYVESWQRRKDGGKRLLAWWCHVLKDAEGNVTGALSTARDITELKRAEETLRESEGQLHAIMENAPDGVYLNDLAGNFLHGNRKTEEIIGYKREEIIGKNMMELNLLAPEDLTKAAKLMQESAQGKSTGPDELTLIKKDGSRIIVEINTSVMQRHGQPVVIGFVRDITERKRAEEALWESEDKFKYFFESANIGKSMTLPTGEINVNKAFADMLGYDREELRNKTWQEITPADEIQTVQTLIDPLLNREKDSTRFNKRYLHKNGSVVWADVSVKIRRDGEGKPLYFVTTIVDITERKRAEEALRESEGKYRTLFDNAGEAIFVAQGGKLVFVNPMTARLLGYPGEEIKQRPFTEFIHPDDRNMVVERHLKRLKGEEVPEVYSFRILCRGGRVLWVDIRGVRIDWEGQAATLNFVSDITERKRAEETIQTSLREKEILLREIHHRVKNNMQVISSLFNLQAGHIKDEDARRMLKEGQLRIRSMALIHEKLYQSRDLSGIEFGGYLQSLADHLFHFFRVDAGLVRLETDIEDVRLDINTAVPLGLLVNELISNSLKHAFPGERKGTVRIRLRREKDGTVKLGVADDGVGFPEAVDFRHAESFGLEIVDLLVGQLEGTIELDRKNGTAFTIAF